MFMHHFECKCGNNFKKKDEALTTEYCSRCGSKCPVKYSVPLDASTYHSLDTPAVNFVGPTLRNSW